MIQDFGEKIEGAAKDRWSGFRNAIGSGQDALGRLPLSKSFPEPNYLKLLKDGEDPWTVAFVRAVRDTVPPKPRHPMKLVRWSGQVNGLRELCQKVLNGDITKNIWAEKINSSSDRSLRNLADRARLYEAIGHEKSMKDVTIISGHFGKLDGVDYSPEKYFHAYIPPKSSKWITDENFERAIAKLSDHMGIGKPGVAKKPRTTKFEVYRNRSTKEFYIGKKVGRSVIRIMDQPSMSVAFKYLEENYDDIADRFARMKKQPAYRGGKNTDRTGPDWRQGKDVTPDVFSEAFGFRGVQFGNYVEPGRRQQDLNNSYDAFMDLAMVLKCDPGDLSLDGELALAFGARGKGGKNPASAHYEPGEKVINLTKTNGAGSLAHEWFHAFDHHVMGTNTIDAPFASDQTENTIKGLSRDHQLQVGSLIALTDDLFENTDIARRCRKLDKYRSDTYYSLTYEVAARSFESWVIDEIHSVNGQNDYLANVSTQEVYEAMDRLNGFEESRYPYPLRDEMDISKDAFDRVFSENSPLRKILPFVENPVDIKDMRADTTEPEELQGDLFENLADRFEQEVEEDYSMGF